MLEPSCISPQVVAGLPASFFGCKSIPMLASVLPVCGRLWDMSRDGWRLLMSNPQDAPSSKKLRHGIYVCRSIVDPSEPLAEVMTLGIGQDFAQKLLQRQPSSAIVRSCDDRPKPRHIAQVNADAQGIREGPWRHGGESVRGVALKASRPRHVRCSGLVSLGRAGLQKAAPPTHDMGLAKSSQNKLRSSQVKKQKDRRWQDSNLRSRRNKISSLAR